MGQVYSWCERVLVWIDCWAIRSGLRSELCSILRKAEYIPDTSIDQPDFSPLLTQIQDIAEEESSNMRLLSSSLDLLESAWFTRAWTFQEVVLAKRSKAVVCWSGLSPETGLYSEEIVTSLPQIYWISTALLKHLQATLGNVIIESFQLDLRIVVEIYTRWVEMYRVDKKDTANTFLPCLLAMNPTAMTSNELDRHYAFFGLNKEPNAILQPDYNLTFREASIQTGMAVIRATCQLDSFLNDSKDFELGVSTDAF
ncbi:hypothetical protein EK21DRAFT_93305 [Setomelanomma holmii]|uniref:Heterokaryon incompatibility domain-containing protein n=1 Tax=Setomelanomma holmii TaxID=210430 RepID=A0A9P4GYQ1_9PLEO|nr:hypothetical protein EK21DRAFT_93305 [Setomelanomma holmii]